MREAAERMSDATQRYNIYIPSIEKDNPRNLNSSLSPDGSSKLTLKNKSELKKDGPHAASNMSLDSIMTSALANEDIYPLSKKSSEPQSFYLKGEKMSAALELNRLGDKISTGRPSYLSITSQQMYSSLTRKTQNSYFDKIDRKYSRLGHLTNMNVTYRLEHGTIKEDQAEEGEESIKKAVNITPKQILTVKKANAMIQTSLEEEDSSVQRSYVSKGSN